MCSLIVAPYTDHLVTDFTMVESLRGDWRINRLVLQSIRMSKIIRNICRVLCPLGQCSCMCVVHMEVSIGLDESIYNSTVVLCPLENYKL